MNPSTEIAARLLVALLSFYTGNHRSEGIRRIAAHQQETIAHLQQAMDAYPIVPPALLISVGFLETHLGYDNGEGGCWGSPIDRRHRHTSGGPVAASRDLAHSFEICGGDWMHAMHRYRMGLCNGTEHVGYTAEQTMRLRFRIEDSYLTEVYMQLAAGLLPDSTQLPAAEHNPDDVTVPINENR